MRIRIRDRESFFPMIRDGKLGSGILRSHRTGIKYFRNQIQNKKAVKKIKKD
jgi:hypothetical protein